MDSIENLGLYFKNIREERRIPLAQIAQELKTKLEIVQAIESNEFEKLPAPTYVKGFLRSYAKYLNLDSDQIIAEYNKKYPNKLEPVLILESKKLPKPGIKTFKPFIFLIILIVIAAAVISFKKNIAKPAENGIKQQAPPQQQQEQEPAAKPKPLITPISVPMELDVKSTEPVWMRAYADEKLLFEGILAKGEQKKWQAAKEFKLRIGNPANLLLNVNGQEIGRVVPYGGPVNIIINEHGVNPVKDKP